MPCAWWMHAPLLLLSSQVLCVQLAAYATYVLTAKMFDIKSLYADYGVACNIEAI